MGAEVKSMDIKKTHQTSVVDTTTNPRKKVQDFVADIKTEIQKVEWTNKDELLTYTKIVVLATFAFGMAIYFMDLIIQATLNSLSLFLRLIAG